MIENVVVTPEKVFALLYYIGRGSYKNIWLDKKCLSHSFVQFITLKGKCVKTKV